MEIVETPTAQEEVKPVENVATPTPPPTATAQELAKALQAERQAELESFKAGADKLLEQHPNCEFYFAIELDSYGKCFPKFAIRLKQ